VRSPLVECALDKAEVRDLAAKLGLSCWDKPAAPCLSSRIPYGLRVTPAKLRRIEAAEAWLQSKGFRVCRVRHPEGGARVEVPPEDLPALAALRNEITAAFQALGFSRVDLDEEGFVSGKLNRVISAKSES